MKTMNVILMILMLVLLNACVVKSLHPFYQDEDVVFDHSLLGSWMDEDSTRWEIDPYTFPKGFMRGDATDNSYLVVLYEEPDRPQRFNVHLFTLNGRIYLDFMPIRDGNDQEFIDVHYIPGHSLALLEKNDDGSLTIGWFNDKWIEELFKENRVKISHELVTGPPGETTEEYILTASTEELQKFIIKYCLPGENGLCVDDDDHFLCLRLNRNE